MIIFLQRSLSIFFIFGGFLFILFFQSACCVFPKNFLVLTIQCSIGFLHDFVPYSHAL